MVKYFFISSFLLFSMVSFCQEGSSSPYSFYGIGETRFNGNVESRSMGGISMIPDSTRINFQNPAGYGNLKLTNFSVGGSTSENTLKSTSSTAKAKRTTLDYISLAIPLGRFGAGFGLVPYSSVGYKTENISKNDNINDRRFYGSGGLNRVFLGAGYRILNNLSIGATAHYNFGKIQVNNLEFAANSTTGSQRLNINDLSGMNFNFGLMFQSKIKDKLNLYSSLYYTPQSILFSDNKETVNTIEYNLRYDYVAIDTNGSTLTSSQLQMPQKWAVGLGIGDAKKWVIGAEVTIQDAGRLNNIYNTRANVNHKKNERFSVGGFFTPSTKQFASYFKKITYRGGFVYEKTGLIINSEEIEDLGMTLGFGLPISGSLSNVNLGFQFGKKGTISNNLVQENYLMVNIGFSLNDKWFVKSKYR
jgi:hypothetical protein